MKKLPRGLTLTIYTSDKVLLHDSGYRLVKLPVRMTVRIKHSGDVVIIFSAGGGWVRTEWDNKLYMGSMYNIVNVAKILVTKIRQVLEKVGYQ